MISVAGAQVISGFRFGFAQPCVIFKVDTPQDLQMPPGTEKRLLQAVSDALPPREDLSGPVEGSDSRHRLLSLSARICAVMQDSVGVPVTHASRILPLPGGTEISSWMVALPALNPNATRFAFHEVIALLDVCLADPAKQRLTQAERGRFDKTLDKITRFSPSGSNTPGFLREALKSGIPITRLPGGAWQYGWGAKARVFLSSLSDATPSIGALWARDKSYANGLLSMAGLPVAEQMAVADIDAALKAADTLGYPVVVKAADLDQGKGVEAGLQDASELRSAFARVARQKRQVLLEKHITGQDVRVNVLHGMYQTAVLRTHASVTGDGVQSIAALMDVVNRDPRRSTRRFSQMRPLTINDEAKELLAAQNLMLDSVPETGQTVRLRRVANVSSGGESYDISSKLHPDNAVLAEKASKLLRLDIAGVDLLLPDPEKSWKETGGAICEVNAQPQIGQTFPTVFRDLFDRYIAGQGRIPTAFVLTDQTSETAGQIARDMVTKGQTQVQVIEDGADKTRSLQESVTAALVLPETTGCIIVSDARDIITTGVPIDRFDTLWLGMWHGETNALIRRIGMLSQHTHAGTVRLEDQFTDPNCLAEAAANIHIGTSRLADACAYFDKAILAQSAG